MTFLELQRPGLNIADRGRGRFANRVGEVKKQWSNLGGRVSVPPQGVYKSYLWALQGTNELMNEFWTHGSVLSWTAQSVQFSSVALSRLTLWPHELQHARPLCPSSTPSRNLLKLMSTELVMPSSYLILCCPLLFLPSIFSSISLFQGVSS